MPSTTPLVLEYNTVKCFVRAERSPTLPHLEREDVTSSRSSIRCIYIDSRKHRLLKQGREIILVGCVCQISKHKESLFGIPEQRARLRRRGTACLRVRTRWQHHILVSLRHCSILSMQKCLQTPSSCEPGKLAKRTVVGQRFESVPRRVP